MKPKSLISIALLLFIAVALVFIVIKNTGTSSPAETTASGPGAAPAAVSTPEHQFIATYFHTDVRCPSCIKIEKLSRASIQANFASQLNDGELVYRMVNIDKPENKHYIKDYGLYTKHLIIAEQRNGKDVRWRDLPQVWSLLGDEDSFKAYVSDGIAGFMAGDSSESLAGTGTTTNGSSS